MTTLLALLGGDEFHLGTALVDKSLLARSPVGKKRVVILPTAAKEKAEAACATGVKHFRMFNVQAEPVMVVDRASANDKKVAAQVQGASVIYLIDGDPAYLYATLQGSLVWQAVMEAHGEGAWIAGSNAGAMVLAQRMRDKRGKWGEAFGLADGVAVLPGHEKLAEGQGEKMLRGLGYGTVLVGIDSGTGCLTDEEGVWEVVGAGSATLYFPGGMAIYSSGETFVL